MNDTIPITDLIAIVEGSTRVPEHRRDPLRTVLTADALALFAMAGLWALWTRHEWLRTIDAAVTVLALCELVRLILSRRD